MNCGEKAKMIAGKRKRKICRMTTEKPKKFVTKIDIHPANNAKLKILNPNDESS